MSHIFITVTDAAFFPGTLATVNSVREFHPESEIVVVQNDKHPLTAAQAAYLGECGRVRVLPSAAFALPGRFINAWELKAYAACDLAGGYEVIIGIDSDCLLCGRVDDAIARCRETGGFLGGQDGTHVDYGPAYRCYGIATPARNPRYLSTSLFFCAVTEPNRQLLRRWAECCSAAQFNGTGPHPGHGDQGVLNAVLFAANAGSRVGLLDNRLWSQHWVYWNSAIHHDGRRFINRTAGDQPQRCFHCSGAEKFWTREHSDRVARGHGLQLYPYLWFLALYWFGPGDGRELPAPELLPAASRHLLADLVTYLPHIFPLCPRARSRWERLNQAMLERAQGGMPVA